MESLISEEKALKHSRKSSNKSKIAERKPYICRINGKSFYSRKSWLKYLDKCLNV